MLARSLGGVVFGCACVISSAPLFPAKLPSDGGIKASDVIDRPPTRPPFNSGGSNTQTPSPSPHRARLVRRCHFRGHRTGRARRKAPVTLNCPPHRPRESLRCLPPDGGMHGAGTVPRAWTIRSCLPRLPKCRAIPAVHTPAAGRGAQGLKRRHPDL